MTNEPSIIGDSAKKLTTKATRVQVDSAARGDGSAQSGDLFELLLSATASAREQLNSRLEVNCLAHPAVSVEAMAVSLCAHRLAYAVVERDIIESFPELLALLDWTPPAYVAAIDSDLERLRSFAVRVPSVEWPASVGGYQRASRSAAWVSGVFYVLLGAVPPTLQMRKAATLHSQPAISGLQFFELQAELLGGARRLPRLFQVHVKSQLERNQAVCGAIDTLGLFTDAFDCALAATSATPSDFSARQGR